VLEFTARTVNVLLASLLVFSVIRYETKEALIENIEEIKFMVHELKFYLIKFLQIKKSVDLLHPVLCMDFSTVNFYFPSPIQYETNLSVIVSSRKWH